MANSHDNPADLVPFFTRRWLESEPAVSAFIFSAVKDFQHAEDLLQTVAMDAAASVDTFDRGRPFGPWIMGIARNRVLKYFRSRGGDRLVFDEATLGVIAAAHEAVADQIDGRRRALRECIERLGRRAREMVRMRYEHDLSAAEIADRLGTTSNVVYVGLHRARKALSDCIDARSAVGGSGDA